MRIFILILFLLPTISFAQKKDYKTYDKAVKYYNEGNNEKAKKLEADLNSIFSFIEKLNELNTEKIEPLTSIAETKLQLRKDEIKSSNIREQILKNSPEENKDFFVVPKVVE